MNSRTPVNVFTLLVAGLMVVLSQLPAGAIPLETIHGYVRDKIGRSVAAAFVSDGFQTVATDATGHYALSEERLQNYSISISKLGMDSPTPKLVTPTDALSDVNFELTYVIGVSVTPTWFNSVPRVLAITVSSYAPSASCIKWTDAASGVEQSLEISQEVNGGAWG